MANQMTAIAATAIQAPSANLLITTMTRTAPVTNAPTVLMVLDRIIRSRWALSVVVFSSRFQCRIMPVWLQVNETNTPTMYSWISRVGEALKAMISTIANPDSSRMPLLNASRSPRVCNWRGR
jgi:hypothetical protein